VCVCVYVLLFLLTNKDSYKCGTGTAYKIVSVYQFGWDRLFPWGMDRGW